MPRHVSCSRCGAIFHEEDLDEDGQCAGCAEADRQELTQATSETPTTEEPT